MTLPALRLNVVGAPLPNADESFPSVHFEVMEHMFGIGPRMASCVILPRLAATRAAINVVNVLWPVARG